MKKLIGIITWINELHVEPIRELRNPRGDLVELHILALAVPLDDEHSKLVPRCVALRRVHGKS
jgi:hypothetical protein